MFNKKSGEPAANKPADNNPHGHKYLDFRTQRALVVIVVELLLITFSVGVIWNHIDNLGLAPIYNTMAKVGLGMVEFIAIVTACWELFARTKLISFWCFVVNLAIVGMMLVHAGAVLRLEATGVEQRQTVENVAKAQAEISAATEKARIEAASKEAERLNSIGQFSTARRIAQAANTRPDDGSSRLIYEVTEKHQRNTFLPDWYMKGGMYVVPPLVSFLLLMFVVFISRGVIHIEDANGDGIPDILQRQQPAASAYNVHPRPIGFANQDNPNITYPKDQPR